MSSPQREAYQLPSQRGDPTPQQSSTSTAAATAGYTPSYGAAPDQAQSSVTYNCGECASKVVLNLGDAIRCKECGHRVLYKGRTKRLVQFEAR